MFQCEELWKGKAHIPCVSMLRGVSKLEAYSLSVKDGKRVSHVHTLGIMFWIQFCFQPWPNFGVGQFADKCLVWLLEFLADKIP